MNTNSNEAFDQNEWIVDSFKRETVISDLKLATYYLHNFTFQVTVHRKQPTYGEIRFSFHHVKAYDRLRLFAGAYGFVVPVQCGNGRKILKGEKQLKYKHLKKEILQL